MDNKTAYSDEPYPVDVYGEPTPIPDDKIGRYLSEDVFYYINIYERIKKFGLPYPTWLDAPQWVMELYDLFERADLEFENRRISQSHN